MPWSQETNPVAPHGVWQFTARAHDGPSPRSSMQSAYDGPNAGGYLRGYLLISSGLPVPRYSRQDVGHTVGQKTVPAGVVGSMLGRSSSRRVAFGSSRRGWARPM